MERPQLGRPTFFRLIKPKNDVEVSTNLARVKCETGGTCLDLPNEAEFLPPPPRKGVLFWMAKYGHFGMVFQRQNFCTGA